MTRQTLNKVMVEVWDAETGIDTLDRDLETVDMRLTVYKTDQDYPDIYKSTQLGVDQFSEAMGMDMQSAFGFTEWMTAMYALTQYQFPKEINNFIIYAVAEQENITVAEIEQAVAYEKNEIRKMEFAS